MRNPSPSLSVIASLGLAISVASCAGNAPSLSDIASSAESVLGGNAESGPLSTDEIIRGLKEALATGSSAVVSQLGAEGGFSADPRIRVPLPQSLSKARDFAAKVGFSQPFDDLEMRLNEAAEAATPKAKALFLDAIKTMSVDDARGILQGPDDAATRYFEGRTGESLRSEMRPIVDEALAQVGAVSTFNNLLDRYNRIPLAPPVDADLTGHVVGEGTEGIFLYLAEEEKAIRENPVARTSEILKRVFGE